MMGAGLLLGVLGSVALAKNTSISAEDMTGHKERQMANCPSAVPGAKTAIDDRKDGVAVTVTAPPGDDAARDQIRRRAHKQLEVGMQPERGSIEHTGHGTGSGKFGYCPGLVQGTRVAVDDVPGGARLIVRATSEPQVQALQQMTRARLRRLQAKR
jgi:hypothetical protein